MVLRRAVLGQQGADSRYVALVAHLIDPAGAEAELGRREHQIFDSGRAVEQGVAVVALAGDVDDDRRAVEIVLGAAVVRLSDSACELQRLFRVVNDRKMPVVSAHAGRRPLRRFNDPADLLDRRKLGLEGTGGTAGFDDVHKLRHGNDLLFHDRRKSSSGMRLRVFVR